MSTIKIPPNFHINDKADASNYLSKLSTFLKDLIVQLTSLTFTENFKTFETGLQTIASGAELKLSHTLKAVPSKKIIVYQVGNGLIADGPTANTDAFVHIKNHGPDSVNVKIVYFR